MSNPVVNFGNVIPIPADPQVVRKTYSVLYFDEWKFFIYAEGEFDPSYSAFDPSDKGVELLMWVPLGDALNEEKPSIVSDEDWYSLYRARSGFLTSRRSVMPKLIVPSYILVDNGLITPDQTYWAAFFDGTTYKDLFNWKLEEVNGETVPGNEILENVQVGAQFGSLYITSKAKDDADGKNEVILTLDNPTNPPLGSEYGWLDEESQTLVGYGAFQLLLNVTPTRPATAEADKVAENPWEVVITFGDVELRITQAGACQVTVAGEDEGNSGTANLSEGKTKEGAPQQQHIDDKLPYVITVVPVWNGVLVSSGVQDSTETVKTSNAFVPKLKKASVLVEPYSSGFDLQNPGPVEVETGEEEDSVEVDFGNRIVAEARNCKFELAYLPCFFTKQCWFDHYLVAQDDTETISYEYNVYPIWTKNNTDSQLGPLGVDIMDTDGPIPDSKYGCVKYRLSQEALNRHAGEIFSEVLEVIETREFPVKNENGSFNLLWKGGTPAGPGGSWVNYIQNVNVTVSGTGSNGTITVDKMGVAGQGAKAIQSIGAVVLRAEGGFGTVAGDIFKGLGIGVGESKDSSGATWSIPLVGLERKLDDMALINVPFFDGEQLGIVFDFLARYAGLIPDTTKADATIRLSASEDINVPRFDWKSGTSIRSALDEVCQDTQHTYAVMNGVIYFYQVGLDGLPVNLGQDWAGDYPDTKLVMQDENPDFEDLRNEIVVIGLQPVPGGQDTNVSQIPLFPRMELRRQITNPDLPWAKSLVHPIPGALSAEEIATNADRLQSLSSMYLRMGRTTIPGNGQILPFDRWGELVIYSVSHSIDLVGKKWTTELEFMSRGIN